MIKFTYDEVKAIKSWTSPQKEYRIIKSILNNSYEGALKEVYSKKANLLIGLFSKYEDNTNNEILYRGDVLENNMKYKIGDIINIEHSILSFTLSKKIAIDSYKRSDKMVNKNTPSILYIIENRKSTFINIMIDSHYKIEQEVLCNIGIKFTIKRIEQYYNNHTRLYLDEF